MPVTAWKTETNPLRSRRLGKLAEEVSECGAVAARCWIQGINEIDPSSGKTNRRRLQEEMADVLAQVVCSIRDLDLDQDFIMTRTLDKIAQMEEWEKLVRDEK